MQEGFQLPVRCFEALRRRAVRRLPDQVEGVYHPDLVGRPQRWPAHTAPAVDKHPFLPLLGRRFLQPDMPAKGLKEVSAIGERQLQSVFVEVNMLDAQRRNYLAQFDGWQTLTPPLLPTRPRSSLRPTPLSANVAWGRNQTTCSQPHRDMPSRCVFSQALSSPFLGLSLLSAPSLPLPTPTRLTRQSPQVTCQQPGLPLTIAAEGHGRPMCCQGRRSTPERFCRPSSASWQSTSATYRRIRVALLSGRSVRLLP
ncbi:hypothetical protein SAMN05444746_1242 [Variovorax sp. OK212]|nr:hypothetical protein SAMN05518853_1232 [Variovorax sp. OK202]SFE41985.1 hypothetical protein SAMN05444746_1242 [Variovorax sp. OK212]